MEVQRYSALNAVTQLKYMMDDFYTALLQLQNCNTVYHCIIQA